MVNGRKSLNVQSLGRPASSSERLNEIRHPHPLAQRQTREKISSRPGHYHGSAQIPGEAGFGKVAPSTKKVPFEVPIDRWEHASAVLPLFTEFTAEAYSKHAGDECATYFGRVTLPGGMSLTALSRFQGERLDKC